MAAYPYTTFGRDSRPGHVDDVDTDRATNGALRGRAYYTARKRTFTLVHPALTAAQRDALLAFYDANRTVGGITLQWQGAIYTCAFADAPKETPDGGGRWRVTMSLAQQ